MTTPHLLAAALLLGRDPRPPRDTAVVDSAAIDAAVLDEMRATRTPGAAIAVVRGDRVVYARGYGVRSVESPETVTATTLFRIGSVTKTVTGVTAAVLAARGALDLDAPVRRYAPALHAPVRDLTMRRLLSHTAGLIQEASGVGSHDDDALARRVTRWGAEETFAPSGDVYSYSSPGYWLAGHVVERVGGAPYADVVTRELLAPLGMTRSTFRPLVAMTYPLALDHRVDSAGVRVLRPFADDASTWPAGSLFSSVAELGRLAAALMNGGRVDGAQAIPARAVEMMHAAQAEVPGDDDERCAYTLGLSLCGAPGERRLSHYGFRVGSGAVFTLLPDRKVAVVILANRSGGIFAATERRVLELLVGPSPRPAARVDGARGDPRAFVGLYVSGADSIRVSLQRDTLRYAYGHEAPSRARVAGAKAIEILGARGEVVQQFLLVRGRSGARYLHDGLNAFRARPD